MYTELGRITELARKFPKLQTLMHYVNADTLRQEHERQASGKATGIDRVTKEAYGADLNENIGNLLKRMMSFEYQPLPVRRTYIPKAGSDKLRPLGIPAYEDKLVQGAMRNVLDAIYEDKFCDFSYGFREGTSCHQAIKRVNDIIMFNDIGWVVDADIKGFFDHLDHEWMMKFLRNDIEDKNFLLYIERFLKAGVVEDLKFFESDQGSPQGGLISPVLANVYLHYTLDLWFQIRVTKRRRGYCAIVRYADDFICIFQYEDDATNFYASLKERLANFGLSLAEDKSKIIPFGRNAQKDAKGSKLDTFDFLGFTHINGRTRKGGYTVQHTTSKKKLKVKRQVVKDWIRQNMHTKKEDVVPLLNKKLIGHYRYYGISGNYGSLNKFFLYIRFALFKTLKRRSQNSKFTWEKYLNFLKHYAIAQPRVYVNIWA